MGFGFLPIGFWLIEIQLPCHRFTIPRWIFKQNPKFFLKIQLQFIQFSRLCKMVEENGTAHFKKCKQLFEYQHLLLLRDIWCSKF